MGPLATVVELNNRKEQLETDLTSSFSSVETSDEDDSQSFQQLQGLLPQSSVLVDFVRCRITPAATPLPKNGNHASYRYLAFVVARGEPVKCLDLGPAERIESLAHDWRVAVAGERVLNRAAEPPTK